MKRLLTLLALSAAAGAALAQATDGEVRKIDKAGGKITIKHAGIAHLDMPPMAAGMVFRVQPPSLLDSVKEGDKVSFQATKAGGAYTITAISVK